MTARSRKLLKATAIFLTGLLVGGATTLIVVVPAFMRQRFDIGINGAAGEGSLFLRLLSQTDGDQGDQAKRALNQLVDSNLLILANYASANAETDGNRLVFRTLESIQHYRRDHPSAVADPEYRARITQAMSVR